MVMSFECFGKFWNSRFQLSNLSKLVSRSLAPTMVLVVYKIKEPENKCCGCCSVLSLILCSLTRLTGTFMAFFSSKSYTLSFKGRIWVLKLILIIISFRIFVGLNCQVFKFYIRWLLCSWLSCLWIL